MSGRGRTSSVSVGHDSFLDIVANLVGILIILVVILGAQSQEVIRQVKKQETPPEKEKVVDPKWKSATENDFERLASTAASAAAAQADSLRLEKTIKFFDAKIDRQAENRTILLSLLDQAEAAWEAEQAKLDSDRQLAVARDAEAAELEQQLEKLQSESEQLDNAEAPIVAISHLPTPMAKTVFGKEIYLRLKDNRVSVVPVEKLMKEIRSDLQRMASGSRLGAMDGAVGPIRGYIARFVSERSKQLVSRGSKIQQMSLFNMAGVIMEPLSEPHGDPIDRVLDNDDWLDILLAGESPGSTTVTVAVYPDSYGAFRKLKEKIYAKGFATAAKPFVQDAPLISRGSSKGSQSMAQ